MQGYSVGREAGPGMTAKRPKRNPQAPPTADHVTRRPHPRLQDVTGLAPIT